MVKQRFFTGLIIILPLTITVWIISFLVHLCTRPFEAWTQQCLSSLDLFQSGWWIFSREQVLRTSTTFAILCGMILVLFVVGFIGRWFLIHFVLRTIETVLSRIPLVNKVYRACREFTDVLFSPKSNSFSQVVWAPFPSPREGAVGVVTNEVNVQLPNGTQKTFTSVLIPGTPNPTVGFLMLYPKDSLAPSNVSSETAIKWVISCGSAEAGQLMKDSANLYNSSRFIEKQSP
jgi:uncharacterized membrane protein